MSLTTEIARAQAPAPTAPAPAAPAEADDVANFKLDNGLEVVVIPDHRAPVVTHMVWYKVGGSDEPPGKSGIAHFLEHLMFKGTQKHPAGAFSKFVSLVGGQENAFTSSDYTAYYQRTTREQLPRLMELEADRMTGLVLTDEVVIPERKVVLEERRMRVDNNPGSKLGEQLAATLWFNHPYRIPVIGWMHEIEQLNRVDALAFYKRFYAPNNAVLVIAGDVTAEEVKLLADKTYGQLPAQPGVGRDPRPVEPEPVAPRTVSLTDPRVTQPSLQRSYVVPSYRIAKPGEAEALEVLAQILGNTTTGRLYTRLVVEKKLAANAGGWYQGSALDTTRFGVYATPTPGTTLAALEAEMDNVLAEMIAQGPTAGELSRAKFKLVSEVVFAQDNQATQARIYGTALVTGMTVADVKAWPDRIRAVTADQVRDAAKLWLEKRRSVTGYLLKPEAPKEKAQ